MFSSSDKKSRDGKALSGMPSIIAKGLVITGDLVCDGEIHVDGIVAGDVQAEKLVIGQTAHITGEIDAREVAIHGKVDGGIKATQVDIFATASIRGDVTSTALSVASGAIVDGHCRHSDNPRDSAEPISLFSKNAGRDTERGPTE